MPQSEAQAWWADVQHVRESIERRRAGGGSTLSADVALERSDDAPWASSDRNWEHADRLRDASDRPWESATIDDSGWPADADPRAGRFDRTDRAARTHRADVPDERRRGAHAGRRLQPADLAWDEVRDIASDDGRHIEAAWDGESAVTPTSPPSASSSSPSALPAPARRTVQITGRTVAAPPLPRLVEVERRRPARRPVERVGPRPDRIAMWAVVLGFFLILVAATSSHAATPAGHGSVAALHAPAR